MSYALAHGSQGRMNLFITLLSDKYTVSRTNDKLLIAYIGKRAPDTADTV
ncbi:MAG: hypothetical protein OSA51_02550 [Octadecabacter sp.]|nr:hypothetical protein [Octadecabacter sp.]